jgi:hypothetical protein
LRGHAAAFAALFALALPGLASLALIVPDMIRRMAGQRALPLSIAQLTAIQIVQAAVLAAIAVAIGLFCAPRVGLRSVLAQRAYGRPAAGVRWTVAIVAGSVLALVLAGLDKLFAPADPALAEALRRASPDTLPLRVAGVLYGGIVEELLCRWALVSLFAWAGWRLFQRRRPHPSRALVYTAIVLAAVIFALGHLPAAIAYGLAITPMLLLRTLVANVIPGIAFGWLFERYSIESAMVSHATVHGVFFALA